jgi:hypothetical protein
MTNRAKKLGDYKRWVGVDIQTPKWRLTRERDGLVIEGHTCMFVEWVDGKSYLHKDLALNRSCVLDPCYSTYTWLTTPITEIISDRMFRTENSVYSLEEIN